MALDTCSAHGVKATGRCFVCHKPTCPACRPRDNTCSDRCFQSKQRFATVHVPPRPHRHATSLLTLIALAAAAYGVARYLGYV